MKLILASKSPRRKEILSSLGVEFQIIPAVGDEVVSESACEKDIAMLIAKAKAHEIFEKYPNDAVIGADTIVVLNGEILQKPASDEEEYQMLTKLSGKTHSVYTGYAFLTKDKKVYGAEQTLVTFNKLSEETKNAYVQSKLGLDKAGGYGIQDGYDLVEKIEGSYTNIVGFPKEVFEVLLKDFGFKN